MARLTRRDLLHSGLALSVGSLVASRTARAGILFDRSATASGPREHLLMDFDWKFFQGNGSDPYADLGFGAGQGDFAKSGDFSFAKAKFEDANWRKLNLLTIGPWNFRSSTTTACRATGTSRWGGDIPQRVWGGTGAPSMFRKKIKGGDLD